jgi:L-lactate dehydrogenase complex protein LldF
VHVVLLDNGRSATLASEEAEMLACIRCGACLNACPVYKQIGGHAYGDTYPGPMGSILTPSLRGLEPWQELPQASSLCGACKDVCPLRIDIPRMLLHLRSESPTGPASVSYGMRLFAAAATRPWLFKLLGRSGRVLLRPLSRRGWVKRGPSLLRGWTHSRDFPVPAKTSFLHWWKDRG